MFITIYIPIYSAECCLTLYNSHQNNNEKFLYILSKSFIIKEEVRLFCKLVVLHISISLLSFNNRFGQPLVYISLLNNVNISVHICTRWTNKPLMSVKQI